MERKLNKEELLEYIEELIIRKADETGRPYHEVSREMREKYQEYSNRKKNK